MKSMPQDKFTWLRKPTGAHTRNEKKTMWAGMLKQAVRDYHQREAAAGVVVGAGAGGKARL